MNQQHDTTRPSNGEPMVKEPKVKEPEMEEPWLVTTDQELTGSYSGTVNVIDQTQFIIAQQGLHYGPLCLEAGSAGRVMGEHLGPLELAEGSSIEVLGHHNGPVEVGPGAVVKVLPGGRLSGTLKVAGLVENRGTRAGNTVLTGGEVHDIDGGIVDSPVITRSASSPES